MDAASLIGNAVTSLVEVWIEIELGRYPLARIIVTSLVEVWIEISDSNQRRIFNSSLPLWKCGLKFKPLVATKLQYPSLPLWKCGLKYINRRYLYLLYPVTSLVEVWIEMMPSCSICSRCVVTSLVEVWIEIKVEQSMVKEKHCHFPCGSVD